MEKNVKAKPARLASLDLLRGADMFLLVVVGPFFRALNASSPLPEPFMAQFRHFWGGFTLWDIIMPLFIFMCGAAIPLSLSKRMDGGRPGARFWKHVASRIALLWVLGMVAQGHLLTFDALKINPFNNTLQAIASGYLVAALTLCIPSRKMQAAMPFALAAVYSLALHFGGDYTMDGNLATRFEYWLLPKITPDGSQALATVSKGYSWWATIPMFGAMTLCGAEATRILSSPDVAPMRRFLRLAGLGAALLAAGLALEPVVPCVKHIYTVSFTAQAMGWCALAYALFYLVADVFSFRRGSWLLLLFGQTSLMAYMSHEFQPALDGFGRMFGPGFGHLFGEKWTPVGVWLASSLLLVAILHVWRGYKAAKRSAAKA